LNDVSELRFDYLDTDGHFNDRWPPANKPKAPVFPVAVRLNLKFAHWGTLTQLYLIPGHNFANTPL
jgi:hypothetical protein